MTDDFVSIGKYANCFNIDNDTYQTNDQGMFKLTVDRFNIDDIQSNLEVLNTMVHQFCYEFQLFFK